MSYLSDWVAKLEEGHTITADDLTVLRRVQMCLLSADKHHRQAREGQITLRIAATPHRRTHE